MSTGMKRNGTRRYNLVLPAELYDEVQRVAEEHHTTVLDFMRKAIKLTLLVMRDERNGAELILRRKDGDTRILLA